MKERRSVLSFGELLDNAFGPPAASASASAPADTEASQLQELLADVAGVEAARVATRWGAQIKHLCEKRDLKRRMWTSIGPAGSTR